MEEHKANGQFRKGVSGNPHGRPRRREPDHSIPAANRRAIFGIANMPVEVTIDGKKEKKTVYEYAMLGLAKAAMKGDLSATKQFLKYVHDSAREDLLMRVTSRQHQLHFDQLLEENERLRAKHGVGGVLVLPPASEESRLDDGRMDASELFEGVTEDD